MTRTITMALCALMTIATVGCEAKPKNTSKSGAITPQARALLEKAIETMGGDAAVAAVKGLHATYEGTYSMGGMDMPYKSELFTKRPGRQLWILDGGEFQGSMGVSGDVCWSQFNAPAARCDGFMREHLMNWELHMGMLLLRPLLDRSDLNIMTTDNANQVSISAPNGHQFILTFDVTDTSATLTRIDGDHIHMDGRKGTAELLLSEPKAFDGIRMPTKLEHKTFIGSRVQEDMTETMVALEWNPELEDTAFAMPAMKIPLDTPALKDVPAMTGLVTTHTGSFDGIGGAIMKSYTLANEAGLMAMGALMAIYLDDPSSLTNPAEMRSEIVVPVVLMGPAPTLPEGVEIRAFPETKMVSMTVRGPYGTVEGPAIKKLTAWAKEQGKDLSGPPRFIYFHNPLGTLAEDHISEIQIAIAE